MRTIKRIRVLIVDDSALVRKMLSVELGKDPKIEIIGTAPDPFVARDKIVRENPDVVLLDIEMPKMDGLTFLRKIMKHHPMKVIVVSSLAEGGSETALKAFEYGALDVMAKPGLSYSVEDMIEELIEAIKGAALAKSKKITIKKHNTEVANVKSRALIKTTNKIIAIGASTGGTEALECLLSGMPINSPPILIVQHMPPIFTKQFASRLNSICRIRVKEAEHMEILAPGKALIAPGNYHVELKRSGAVYHVRLSQGERVNRHRPAVDVMFDSVAKYAGKNAIGVILTGMGKDGAEGMLKMKNEGAYTIAQNEASCVVFGMPNVAIELGGVCKILAIDKITKHIINNI